MENQERRGDAGNATRTDASNQSAPRDNNAENFPGYPSYKPEEDITAQGERVSANMEGVSRANNQTESMMTAASDGDTSKRDAAAGGTGDVANRGPKSAADTEGGSDPDADVTEEDLMMLDRADRGIDESDDAQAPTRAQLDETDEDGDPLNEAAGREGMLGDDIDVPGSEDDDANENIGEEDEENNYYSLGGDEKSGLDDANEGSINRV